MGYKFVIVIARKKNDDEAISSHTAVQSQKGNTTNHQQITSVAIASSQ